MPENKWNPSTWGQDEEPYTDDEVDDILSHEMADRHHTDPWDEAW